MFPTKKTEQLAHYLLISVHVAGILGFILLGKWFWHLSWFNLGLCTFIILFFSQQKIDAILLPFLLAAGIGFAAEVIGVKTGFPFGYYLYGHAFGIKLLAVPIMIGVNWAMLNYCCIQILKTFKLKNNWLLIIGTAALMTGMDYLIEQVCMYYDFWYFQQGKAGIANYISWFCISGLISYFTLKKFSNHYNSMAVKLFYCQLFFFISLNLYHYLK
jgi:bisanhydrobacterioruberin hydratase